MQSFGDRGVSVHSQIRLYEGAGEMGQWEKMLTTQACRLSSDPQNASKAR